ncbi:MAG: hypothetical protein E7620_05695 [Ruminococcaceae bacterium]|nr:hypothetical protein [Oscillospiraceae bacterium]
MGHARKILCLLLAFFTLFSLASCGDQPNEGEGNKESNPIVTIGGTAEPDSEEDLLKPEQKDYDREFKFMVDGNYYCYVPKDYQTGEGNIIDEAMYKRNLFMDEMFGVDVVYRDEGTTAYSTFSVAVTAGEYVSDSVLFVAQKSFQLLQQGLYSNLANLKGLNLSASYWDQRIQSEYAIGDKVYFLEGDYTVYDELRTYVVLYNKRLYESYNYYTEYGTLYDMVENQTWTLEKMMEMSEGLYSDENHNNVRDEFDKYGIVGALNFTWCAFLGSGLKTISNNNGELTLMIKDASFYQRTYDVLEAVTEMCIDEDILQPQLMQHADVWTAASNVFENNQALFRATTLSAATRLSNMSAKFGLVPIPAFSEDQGGYFGWATSDSHTPLSMPRTVEDKEETAEILEVFCYYSRYLGEDSLYNSFIESFRLQKFCETEQDLAMLELIFEAKLYDFDYCAQITNIPDKIWSMTKAQNYSELASSIASLRGAAQAKMDAFLLAMSKYDY